MLAAMLSFAGVTPAVAQTAAFPTKAITFVVPFPPGGSTDRAARLIGQRLTASVGQPVVIDNRGGGAGAIGALAVKQAAPDGHVLLIGHMGTHAINPSLYEKLAYDPVKDFRPITPFMSFPSVVVVPANSPAKSLMELVQLAKAKPGGLSYSSQGIGTGGHLQGAMLQQQIGVPLVHVPMKGAAAATAELVAGRVDLLFSSYITAGPFIRDGRLRMLAMASSKRSPALPDLPTTGELGLPGVELDYWFGFFAPAGTPDATIRKLNEELVKAVRHPEVSNTLTEQAADVISSSPEEFAKLIERDTRELGKVVRATGAKAD
jgi:tripartite-type tricarboxylate transporter receptor subunit TctC